MYLSYSKGYDMAENSFVGEVPRKIQICWYMQKVNIQAVCSFTQNKKNLNTLRTKQDFSFTSENLFILQKEL